MGFRKGALLVFAEHRYYLGWLHLHFLTVLLEGVIRPDLPISRPGGSGRSGSRSGRGLRGDLIDLKYGTTKHAPQHSSKYDTKYDTKHDIWYHILYYSWYQMYGTIIGTVLCATIYGIIYLVP